MTGLRAHLTALAQAAPLTFAAFMEAALYHPDHGYYSTGKVRLGEGGDFSTAPHLGPLFARCLANLAVRADRILSSPATFTLVEGGPGEGLLARGILDRLEADFPDLYRRTLYVADEVSPALALRQREKLAPHLDRVASAPPPDAVGLYLSNELVDAFPIHLLEVCDGELFELYVAPGDDGFVEVAGPVSSPEVEALGLAVLERTGETEEPFRFEVCPAARPWLKKTASAFSRGVIATIDYGDRTNRLYGPMKPLGTARGYCNGVIRDDLLTAPGTLDLTASVDFSALEVFGGEIGLAALSVMNQRELLFGLGVIEEVATLEDEIPDEAGKMALRLGLHDLLMPGAAMGETFKALIQGIGVDEGSLSELLVFP